MLGYGGNSLSYFRGINLASEILRKVGNERFHHERRERTAKVNANNFCFLEKEERVSLISGYVGF